MVISRMTQGVLIGVGVSALAFCLYKQNEAKVDLFLQSHGINVKTPARSFENMDIEDLMRSKERIEDLIAEKELEEQAAVVEIDVAEIDETADA